MMIDYDLPHCPECGAECEDIYLDKTGNVLGCENCIRKVDAYKFCEE